MKFVFIHLPVAITFLRKTWKQKPKKPNKDLTELLISRYTRKTAECKSVSLEYRENRQKQKVIAMLLRPHFGIHQISTPVIWRNRVGPRGRCEPQTA